MGGAVSSGRNNDELVSNLCHGGLINSTMIEEVFRVVDRGHYFLDDDNSTAYSDVAWKNNNLHISAPCIYSEVMRGLQLKPGLSFINIGSGTGYLSTMVGLLLGVHGTNHGIELFEDVVEHAETKLSSFIENALHFDWYDFCTPQFVTGNCLNLPKDTLSYDRVYCGAECPDEYVAFMKNLVNPGGILIMPHHDQLKKYVRSREDEDLWDESELLPVNFAKLIVRSPVTNMRSRNNSPNVYDAPVEMPERSPPSLQACCRSIIRKTLRDKFLKNFVRKSTKAPSVSMLWINKRNREEGLGFDIRRLRFRNNVDLDEDEDDDDDELMSSSSDDEDDESLDIDSDDDSDDDDDDNAPRYGWMSAFDFMQRFRRNDDNVEMDTSSSSSSSSSDSEGSGSGGHRAALLRRLTTELNRALPTSSSSPAPESSHHHHQQPSSSRQPDTSSSSSSSSSDQPSTSSGGATIACANRGQKRKLALTPQRVLSHVEESSSSNDNDDDQFDTLPRLGTPAPRSDRRSLLGFNIDGELGLDSDDDEDDDDDDDEANEAVYTSVHPTTVGSTDFYRAIDELDLPLCLRLLIVYHRQAPTISATASAAEPLPSRQNESSSAL